MENQIINYLLGSEDLEMEHVELLHESENAFIFAGYQEGDDQELTIEVTVFNEVIFNGEPQDVYLPFNVYSN